MNIIEQGIRQHCRFASTKGLVTVEDLYYLPLEEVDKIAIALNKDLKEQSEESFLLSKTKSSEDTALKLEIAKHIIKTRLQEQEDRRLELAKKAQKEKILSHIERKEDESLAALSTEELKEIYESL